MMYQLIKKQRGKETVIMVDDFKKVKDHKKHLEDSQRGKKIEYFVKETDATEKFKKKPENHNRSGDCQVGPPRIRK